MRTVALLTLFVASVAARAAEPWSEVAPGVFRSPGNPAAHALTAEGKALLIDLPPGVALEGIPGVAADAFEMLLLTHHHRDTAGGAAEARKRGITVRGPKAEADWLTVEGVAKYWKTMLPVPSSKLGYLMLPAGIEGVRADIEDGAKIEWRGWTITAVATPGHTRGHVAFAAKRGESGKALLFCGDALASDGKMWSPYSTDWDHWTDAGLAPAAATLRRLAEAAPDVLLPAHGPPIAADCVGVLRRTADRLAEAGYLKSFERFTKQRLGNAPSYRMLVPRETVVGLGGKTTRFTEVSEHVFIHDNTYILTSKSGRALIIDLFGKGIVDKVKGFATERKIAGFDAMLVSHAHYDHYLGIHDWTGDALPVWGLARVAEPIEQPLRFYAPFLEPRPVPFARRFKDGETIEWQEYRFTIHHYPGQTDFTEAIEATIDGRRCLFTADNWYHQDHFSGSGGWMSLNRAPPSGYAASARKTLAINPEWILAEHGGPFEFNREDFRRRALWGDAASLALDAISPSGDHRRDWDIHRIGMEPLVQPGKAGQEIRLTVNVVNPSAEPEEVRLVLDGRGLAEAADLTATVAGGKTLRTEWVVRLKDLPAGRTVFAVRTLTKRGDEPADTFFAVDVADAR